MAVLREILGVCGVATTGKWRTSHLLSILQR